MARVPLPPAEPMKLARLAEIARGGMGSVELARVEDGRLAGQIVAVKRLHANIASDPQFVSMFLDEAWLTAALHHVNVVAVAAWGDDDRGMFLAIEFVQGVSLQRLLKESKVNKEMFAERTVANLCSQICAGLTAAHSLRGADGALLGLVHRDLTPGNVLVHRVLHDAYLAKVKTKAQVKEEYDYEEILNTIPAEKAFGPVSADCKM